MSKRLEDIEERRAFQEFKERRRRIKGRSEDELLFFAIHGSLPETTGEKLPKRQEFIVCGIRTVVTTERAKEPKR
jgi:hypothetical protein